MKNKSLIFLLITGIQTCFSLYSMDNNNSWLVQEMDDNNYNNQNNIPEENNIDEQNNEAALIDAVRQGLNAVREYLDRGGDARAGEGAGMYEAARRGDSEIIELLFNRGINMEDFTTSALEIAVQHGQGHLIPLLALLGADTNPAFLQAQYDGHQNLVALLETYNIDAI